jgi:tetratricopeptide (TPR) repeat protein
MGRSLARLKRFGHTSTMPDALAIAVAGALAIAGLGGVLLLLSRGGKGRKEKKPAQRDRAAVLRYARRKLSQDPRDVDANLALAELYFREENYAGAYQHYRLLLDLCAANPTLPELDITIRHALCALHQGKTEEAYKGLMIAWSMDKSNFDVNFNLGVLEHDRKAYQRAATFLTAAQAAQPEHLPTARYLGLSEYRQKRYAMAASLLRKWLDAHPEDKECVAVQGQCYFYMKRFDLAGRIFQHLRADPEHGPLACLYSATMRLHEKNYDAAIADLQIGLRHSNVPRDMALEMKYRIASAHLRMNRVDQATVVWREILEINRNYKDVRELVKTYQELSSNKHLQTYMMGTQSEYANLCRRLARVYFSEGTVKVSDVSQRGADYADVVAEVATRKWEESVLFRFLRSTGDVGDLLLRDLNERLKDLHASRGVCFTAGKYNEGARAFVEARLIDLCDKGDLLKLLHTLTLHPQFVV